jgi:hypothetical protein
MVPCHRQIARQQYQIISPDASAPIFGDSSGMIVPTGCVTFASIGPSEREMKV